MKKRLDDTTITNELKEASLFFRPRTDRSADQSMPSPGDTAQPPPSVSAAPPPARAPETPNARTPQRRTIARFSFELFQDQMDNLRRFSLEEKLAGDKGSMSEMARDALDAYIATRRGSSG